MGPSLNFVWARNERFLKRLQFGPTYKFSTGALIEL